MSQSLRLQSIFTKDLEDAKDININEHQIVYSCSKCFEIKNFESFNGILMLKLNIAVIYIHGLLTMWGSKINNAWLSKADTVM